MVFVEKNLEDAIVNMLRDALPGVRVESSWGQVPEGEEKGVETPDDGVAIAVAVGAPEWDRYLVPSCSLPVALAVTVRRETAPDAAALSRVMAPIANMLFELQSNVAATWPLSIPGFNCGGVRVDGGTPPAYSAASGIWRMTRSFTVRGVMSAPEEEESAPTE